MKPTKHYYILDISLWLIMIVVSVVKLGVIH